MQKKTSGIRISSIFSCLASFFLQKIFAKFLLYSISDAEKAKKGWVTFLEHIF